ncbi:MAG: hypothetical protein AB2693_35205, partial [Candidatus Thiodiazotropha sp.]
VQTWTSYGVINVLTYQTYINITTTSLSRDFSQTGTGETVASTLCSFTPRYRGSFTLVTHKGKMLKVIECPY